MWDSFIEIWESSSTNTQTDQSSPKNNSDTNSK